MRTIAVVTTSRADYSHLYWVLREIAAHPDLQLRLIVMGPQLAPGFGSTVQEIERDGWAIDARVECLLDSDSDVGMAKTIGVATLGLADSLGQIRPDLLLLIADRYEMLAPAAVALALRIPVAHIEGGEVSQGAIDDAVRNALTKLSHLHFTSTEAARQRVIGMGEEEWRVHQAGAPSLDHLRRSELLNEVELQRIVGADLTRATMLVTFHPVTIARDTTREADALFEALAAVPEQVLFCYPNADAGGHQLIERVHKFAAEHHAVVAVNLNPVKYWSVLRCATMVVGNSSSGIMEAASFGIPVVDVGMRQRGRERGRNVISVAAEKDEIVGAMEKARSTEFRKSATGMENPYGDGRASERIVRVLAEVELSERFLIKI